MIMPAKDWFNSKEIKKLRDLDLGELYSREFFRDPLRITIVNHDLLYAPADGVVLYAKEFDPDDFLEIKGVDFTLAEMLVDPGYKERSLVIGIFMTAFDVHVNRAPASSLHVSSRATNNIYTHNVSMIMEENGLLYENRINKNKLGYLIANERKISVFYTSALHGVYYIVQVGDRDVDVIINWRLNQHILQGDRFGQIRFGSQVDIVIPVKYLKYYEILVKPLDHVEAGLDPIIRIMKG